MRIRLGVGIAVVALASLLLAAATAAAATLTGGTDQPGDREVRIVVADQGPVESASFEWLAKCHKGGAIRSATQVDEFNRVTRAQFADTFKGKVRDGRHSLKLRYVFVGKRQNGRRGSYFGTFRLSTRYVGRNKPVKGVCRTRLVRWKAFTGGRG